MCTDEEFEQAVKDLEAMFDRPVDAEVLRNDLRTYLEKYLMELEPSKRAVFKDHGGSDRKYVPAELPVTPISDLIRGERSTVKAFVVNASERFTRNGDKFINLKIHDGSGSSDAVIWKCDPLFHFIPGSEYIFRNVSIEYSDYERQDRIMANGSDNVTSTDNSECIIFRAMLDDCPTPFITRATVTDIIRTSDEPRVRGILEFIDESIPFISWTDLDLESGSEYIITQGEMGFDSKEGCSIVSFDRDATSWVLQ